MRDILTKNSKKTSHLYVKGDKVAEGKTKVLYTVLDGEKLLHDLVYVTSKDRITAHNALRSNTMEGKAQISNATTTLIYHLLNSIGVPTHFISLANDDDSFIAKSCQMIPIEWVVRRLATGSFIKRHPGVKEGYLFPTPKLETFFKDDAAGDPEISEEEILCSKDYLPYPSKCYYNENSKTRRFMYQTMAKMTVLIFEILERIWLKYFNVTLVDMKVEFGFDNMTGQILLADVIDNDSWRLWPEGDKNKMVDKQIYRDLKEVSDEKLDMVKDKYLWVLEKLQSMPWLDNYTCERKPQILIMLASPGDLKHGQAIKAKIAKILLNDQYFDECLKQPTFNPEKNASHRDDNSKFVSNGDIEVGCSFPVNIDIRIASAHKNTKEVLAIIHQFEAIHAPLVIIACAGLSNGLGPVIAGNATCPVINCPPPASNPADLNLDIWSSLRMPSGILCSTVLSPDSAALAALSSLAIYEPLIWCHLRAHQVINNQLAGLQNDLVDY